MAKIQDLNVVTLKIKSGSLTQFFTPYSGSYGTDRYIQVTFDTYSTPALIFVDQGSGTTNLYYNPGAGDQELIYQVTGNMCVAIGDLRPAGLVTYGLQGTGSGYIRGAMMRFR